MRKLTIVLLIASLISASSCRSLVLEDRSVCPAWVDLILSSAKDNDETGKTSILLWRFGQAESRGYYTQDELFDGVRVSFPRGVASFSGLVAPDLSPSDPIPSLLIVPPGDDCPEWFAFNTPSKEYVSETPESVEVTQYRMHVGLNFRIRGGGYTFRATCIAGVDGFSYPSLELHKGEFSVVTTEEDYYLRTAVIPRQSYGTEPVKLIMHIDYIDTETGRAYPVTDFDLAKEIEGHYDWSKPILDDIDVEVLLENRNLVKVIVRAEDWTVVWISEGEEGATVI